MEWWQAATLALFCYLGALTTPWALGTTGGWYVITRPLVAGLISGIVLGDVKTGARWSLDQFGVNSDTTRNKLGASYTSAR